MSITSDILSKLMACKGKIRTVKFKRPMQLRKDYKSLDLIKETVMQVRCGIKFDATKESIEGRKDGTLPVKNTGLKGRKWVIYPFVLSNDKGELLFRFQKVNSLMQTKVTYYLNGAPVEESAIKDYCVSDEFRKRDKPSSTFDSKLDSIAQIT